MVQAHGECRAGVDVNEERAHRAVAHQRGLGLNAAGGHPPFPSCSVFQASQMLFGCPVSHR